MHWPLRDRERVSSTLQPSEFSDSVPSAVISLARIVHAELPVHLRPCLCTTRDAKCVSRFLCENSRFVHGYVPRPFTDRITRSSEMVRLLLFVASVLGVQSRPRVATAAAPSLTLPPARTYGDVVRTSCQSFGIVGTCAFGWTMGQGGRPLVHAMRTGLQSAQRWGRISAGFSGGKALSQVIRSKDDEWCAIMGACVGGLLGAPSPAQIPVRVVYFATAAYILEMHILPRVREPNQHRVRC